MKMIVAYISTEDGYTFCKNCAEAMFITNEISVEPVEESHLDETFADDPLCDECGCDI